MENLNKHQPDSFEIVVSGRVQGVGFRYFAMQRAIELASPAGCGIRLTIL